ncbi:MAG TPA: AsnC family transcriptional regulator [Nitrospiria bacterium]|nr:AsnC family transcriptional regulator [Nitrospiria bacterium]
MTSGNSVGDILIDQIDRRLLNILQSEFPLSERPFRKIAEKLDTSEAEVIERVTRLKHERIIRQISAIFDTQALGYKSSLVAAKIDPSEVDNAASIINQHPGVSHNYLRNNEYNLWFTIAVPPNSRFGLEGTIGILKDKAGAEEMRILPTLRLFKIGVRFDMSGEEDLTSRSSDGMYSRRPEKDMIPPLTEREILVIRGLQKDISVTSSPFDLPAREAGVDTPTLLNYARGFMAQGRMRRFAAVLHHRRAGFRANAMGVWVSPERDIEETGRRMAAFSAVSHCYQRPSYPDWPYNIFTMVHGRTVEDCEEILARMSDETGIMERSALYSEKEYKKTRVVYFTPEIDDWEKRYT